MSIGLIYDTSQLLLGEIVWREHYYHLKSCGYTLRKRYHPDWTPSWANTSKNVHDCEDALHLLRSACGRAYSSSAIQHHLVADATRADGSVVAIKCVDVTQPQNDIPMLRHLSSDKFTSNPRNHCVPIFDILEPLEGSNIAFVVMPLLYLPNSPSFGTIGEALAFWKQMIEVDSSLLLPLLATESHRRISTHEFSETHLFDSPPHPRDESRTRDFSARVKQVYSRTTKPVKYYLIDFGLSKVYQPEDAPFLKKPPWGGDKTVPEIYGSPDSPPCDPFAVDVYCLGNYLRQTFLDGWDGMRPMNPQGFEFLRELIKDMVNQSPSNRPRMSEVAFRFDAIVAKQ
ncbi:hypothetical protein H0H93_001588, partial [Arthromyces matolae]